MILQQLYALAHRAKLVESPAFKNEAIPLSIVLDLQGNFIAINEHRGKGSGNTKKTASSTREDGKGRIQNVPVGHRDAAIRGAARFLVDVLSRILPLKVADKDAAKSKASQETFWKQIAQAATECRDGGLEAVGIFGRSLSSSEDVRNKILAAVTNVKGKPNERCSFEIVEDGGVPLLARQAIREWYIGFFNSHRAAKQSGGPTGVCQITRREGPISVSHPILFQGVPRAHKKGAYLVSNNPDAFQSYGLKKSSNASVSEEGVDGYSQALKALLENRIPNGAPSRVYVGESIFLFWTREQSDLNFISLFDRSPDAESEEDENEETSARVEALFRGTNAGTMEAVSALEPNQFYMLELTANSVRLMVRSYLSVPLARLKERLLVWFGQIKIASATKRCVGKPSNRFSVWQLAISTTKAGRRSRIVPDVATRLMSAAIEGTHLPDSLLLACLQRLRVEGSKGFRQPARLALIKLILIRGGVAVKVELDPDDNHPAYLCGRLLSILERLQYAALGKVNAGVVDKFYGTFSSSPGTVFARLLDLSKHHLRKIRSESGKEKRADSFDWQIGELLLKLPSSGPPANFSLQEQGRFAIGFYHEKAKRMADSAKAKIDRAMKVPRTM